MGRWGSLSLNSDAAHDFLWDAFAGQWQETGSANKAWAIFFKEWSDLPEEDKEAWGFEYLFSVVELWVLDEVREGMIAIKKDSMEESKNHKALYEECKLAMEFLDGLGKEEMSDQTRKEALELGSWGKGFWERRFSGKELSEDEQKDKDSTLEALEATLEELNVS